MKQNPQKVNPKILISLINNFGKKEACQLTVKYQKSLKMTFLEKLLIQMLETHSKVKWMKKIDLKTLANKSKNKT